MTGTRRRRRIVERRLTSREVTEDILKTAFAMAVARWTSLRARLSGSAAEHGGVTEMKGAPGQ